MVHAFVFLSDAMNCVIVRHILRFQIHSSVVPDIWRFLPQSGSVPPLKVSPHAEDDFL